VAQLPFLLFDADNHYYEALDAFTRHVEPGFEKRCMQWAEVSGRTRLLVGGRVNRFIPNPTFGYWSRPDWTCSSPCATPSPERTSANCVRRWNRSF
jgi:hypothetical protein